MSSFFFSPLRIVGGAAVGVGVGGGIATVIEPILRELANEGWARYQTMPLDAVDTARVVASGERDMAWGIAEAQNTGVSPERFAALVDMIDEAPDLSTLFDLLHRRLISASDFREGARKGMIEDKWIDALLQLAERVLSPAEAANAWQQGFLDEGEAEAEAALSGVSPERSAIQRELAGLPPGAMDSLVLLRRGIVDEETYRQIVREGHVKTKYTDALLALRDQILSASDAAELWLRGWIDEAEAKRIGRLNGYGSEEMDRLYQNRGRPATTRQVFLGLRRGGRRGGPTDEIAPDFLAAVRNSNIRTEYANILWAQRFTYPSLFQLNRLVTAGALSVERGREILWNQGWETQDIDALVAWWEDQLDAPAARWAGRAATQLWNVVHREYLDLSLDEGGVRDALTLIGVPAAEQARVVTLWTREREVRRAELTPAQIRKAYKATLYTRELALSELDERGYTPEDAATLLDA